MELRRALDRLISTMGIPILVKWLTGMLPTHLEGKSLSCRWSFALVHPGKEFRGNNPRTYALEVIWKAWCKNDVSPVLWKWSYVYFAFSHRYVINVANQSGYINCCCHVSSQTVYIYIYINLYIPCIILSRYSQGSTLRVVRSSNPT